MLALNGPNTAIETKAWRRLQPEGVQLQSPVLVHRGDSSRHSAQGRGGAWKSLQATGGVQRIAVFLLVEEQEGEGGNQLQEELGAEDGSYRPGEELQQGQTSQVYDGRGQEGPSPKRREDQLRREQSRRSCKARRM